VTTPTLVIRGALPLEGVCGICGTTTRPPGDFQIYLADSWQPVCPACAMGIDPDLANLLNEHYMAADAASSTFPICGLAART
jgi:hypothetical protein